MQRTIYIKDDDWDQIREWAGKDGRSVSGYLVNAHLDFIGRELLEEVCKVIPSPKSLDEVFNEAVDELAEEKKDSTFSTIFLEAKMRLFTKLFQVVILICLITPP